MLPSTSSVNAAAPDRSSTFETVDYDREKLLATFHTFRRCRHGAATTTKVEMREKKDRVADAQQATAAAVEEIPPGGGRCGSGAVLVVHVQGTGSKPRGR